MGVVILSVQLLQHREFAELRWDGATNILTRGEGPERATMKQCEQLKMCLLMSNQIIHVKSEIGGRCDSERTASAAE